MNARSLTYLAGATVLVAAVAAITLKRGESAVQATPVAGKLFPDLAASINDVTSIELKRKDGVTTLKRVGETWGLAEKSGYPVDMAAVRKTLIGLSDLAAAEPRTDDPKLYSKVGVDDPSTEGSTSTLVTLKDSGGKDLASLIIGKGHSSKSFSGPHQVYVRKPGEARSWLAVGEMDLKEKSADWLDKKILEVKRERIRAAEVRHADGEVVLVDRDKPDTKDFTLHDIPEGKELTYPSAPSSLADALGYLNLEDVVPVGEVDLKEGISGTAKFSCFDGLTVTVTTKEVGEKTYARFEASYEKPPESTPSSGPPAPPEAEPKKDASDEPDKEVEGEKKDAAEKPKIKSPEEVQKEAADLDLRLSKWVYVIPSYNKTSFEKKKSELLKDKAPPPPPPGTGEAKDTPPDTTEPPKSEPAGGENDPLAKPPPGSKPPAKDQETKPPTPPKADGSQPETPPESKPPRSGIH
jgi:hypothetical protein